MKLYVDLDGVLADFDQGYFNAFGVRPDKVSENVEWRKVSEATDFYLGLPPMPDMLELWHYVVHLGPTILTGLPYSVRAAPQNKRDWVANHLGPDVPVITCLSRDKCQHAEPGDILIDDWTKHKTAWERAGGIWVTHTSAADTIVQLKALGI